jgi:hypothetical protein
MVGQSTSKQSAIIKTKENTMEQTSANQNKTRNVWGLCSGLAVAVMFLHQGAMAVQLPVNLRTAGNFVILSESGISSVPTSALTGDIGVSPIDSTAITGFSLNHSPASPFATSAQITGKAYAPDYADPTPANLVAAVGDMETAYTDAAGRSLPDFTDLGDGQIGGLTLAPGLYKWGTDVSISTDVTLNGGPNDVWILQVAGDITQADGKQVVLTGGALPQNIFWQCSGVVTMGGTAHLEGVVLAKTSIALAAGASVNGRLLAQTAVTLVGNTVTAPNPLISAAVLMGAPTINSPYTDVAGQTLDPGTRTITAPMSGDMQFYRLRSGTALTITGISISGGNVVITYN